MAIINMRAMSAIRETFVLPVRVLIRFLQPYVLRIVVLVKMGLGDSMRQDACQ